MIDAFMASLNRPAAFTPSTAAFWDDEHISRHMLKAHLDPDFEGASRKAAFMEASVAWIRELLPPSRYPRLLDLGCGPGLYAEGFTRAGYRVTGMDLSGRSIGYARQSASRQGLAIAYLHADYLKTSLEERFDVCTMIYCDYGVLPPGDRWTLLNRVFRHLRPGGMFLFDVFSLKRFHAFEEKRTWEFCPDGGFWRAGEYVGLFGSYRYPGHVLLDMAAILEPHATATYYLWTACFSRDALAREAESAGFEVRGVFGDVAGGDEGEGETMAILLEKPRASR